MGQRSLTCASMHSLGNNKKKEFKTSGKLSNKF